MAIILSCLISETMTRLNFQNIGISVGQNLILQHSEFLRWNSNSSIQEEGGKCGSC